ncbi:MAG: thioredoxin domain-containing protein [Bacteroidales bacterium]|nr:thioredoxin domain-containing protein [Bacteroidales bacterium]
MPPNQLIRETSPYLLQHAHNPVEWHPWNESTLQKARSLDKMLLISIGYSACHWCHVMERESFEDEEVAALMNRHFVCIKVDREERPDVDQVYMHAVQLITGSGGWPLNCFALPDGRPFFGGTYFRKHQWIQLLENIAILFSTRRKDLEEQATALAEGIRANDLVHKPTADTAISFGDVSQVYTRLEQQFDLKEGGSGGAPKFPMPVNLSFLLHFFFVSKNDNAASFIHLTLRKMAYGGIYDQIGGGFARYSSDTQWKVPHFEKMLYDNAQLLSLYSEAWQAFRVPLYKEVAEETAGFIMREMTGPDGGFYAALDADSEGEEGKFYTWTGQEMKDILGKQYELIRKYYQVDSRGLWEDNRNILLRIQSPDEFAKSQGHQPSAFKSILKPAKAKLLKARNKRIRPGLDNKILTSWNAMMISGFIDAYLAFGNELYLKAALRCAGNLFEQVTSKNGGLYHQVSTGKNQINGFLDDYAFSIQALLKLYQVTFGEQWLDKARLLADYTLEHFYDKSSGLFFYTSALDPALIARKKEIYDTVIPSCNSVMADVLLQLGLAFEDENYTDISSWMLSSIREQMLKYTSSFGNWASVLIKHASPFYSVVITGPEFLDKALAIRQQYHPSVLIFGSVFESSLPIMKDRFVAGETMIFVCNGRECKLPTTSVEKALKDLNI